MGFLDFFIGNKDKKRQRYYLKALAELAKSDGNFDEKEYAYILNIASGFSITQEELDRLISKPLNDDYLPKSNNEKLKLIYDLLSLALTDRRIDSREQRMVEKFAKKMEFPGQMVKELIESMVQNILNGNPFDETMKRIDFLVNPKKYSTAS